MQKIENNLSLKNMTFLKPWKQIVFFAIGLVGLITVEVIFQLLLVSISKAAIPSDYEYDIFIHSSLSNLILNGASYLTVAIIFIILIKDDSSEFFKSFKGWRPYVAGLIGFSAIIIFNIVYSNILNATGLVIADNTNEASLNSIVVDYPFASLLIFAFIGPIVEELTYRVGLFSFMRRVNVVVAYIVTIIVFTLIHFDFSSSTMTNELLNIPFYAFAAFTFTFLYEKYGLAGSASAHITNNLFSLLSTILISIGR